MGPIYAERGVQVPYPPPGALWGTGYASYLASPFHTPMATVLFGAARGTQRPLSFLSVLLLLPATALLGQTTITIGTGTVQNDQFSYPAPYGNAQNGARHQMLVLASELQAAGMTAGDISSVSFNVASPAFVELTSFTVSIGTTTQSQMTPAWVQGLTPVWGPQPYTDQAGWNEHVFDTPFSWDGVSNIVVQTCFANTQATFNAVFYQTTTAFNSITVRNTPNPNVCVANTGTLIPMTLRPNMRFAWTPLAAPPIAAFTTSTLFTCDGTVRFTDASQHIPSSWAWDFGDGGTDTIADPVHTYATDGSYTPTLIVANDYGADTITGPAIEVNGSGPRPVAACAAISDGTVHGLGILSATINTSTVTSPDAATEGYADRSCHLDTVLTGTYLHLGLTTGTAAPQFARVWVDWDNSGDFIASELVLTADNVYGATDSVLVPSSAVMDTPLRVRFMVDYPFAPSGPCAHALYGQAEDYGLVVRANTEAPEAHFSATPTHTCDGLVQFTDASLNGPSSWEWDFGDASGPNNEASPQHAYAASGTYTVTLIVTNANGADTLTLADLVQVDLDNQLVPAACIPETQSYCCGYGITSVQFAGINSTSPDGVEGYVDRSCDNVAAVEEGHSYPIAIGTGGDLQHDVHVWLDLNNDGSFGPGEEIWSALNTLDPTGNVIIPSGSVYGQPLRLRITADVVGEVNTACDAPLYGQTEDMSAILSPNPDPPVAQFTAAPTNTCNGIVQFTDGSLNAPTSWSWDFGDSQTSSTMSPLHTYSDPGVYTVSLTVTNANGSDTQTFTDLIHFTDPVYCDTLLMPDFQDASSNACQGVLADNGGPNGPYLPGPGAAFTIAPTDAEVVVLTFSDFEWGNNPNRTLAIYDGPDVGSPLIGAFTGNGLAQLPNNGIIISSGGSITLRQEANGGGPPPNAAGFLLTWDCSYTGIAAHAPDPVAAVYPQPATDRVYLRLTAAAGEGWRVVVHDLVGAEVAAKALRAGDQEQWIDVNEWAPGGYVLSLLTPQGRWNRMIVVR